MGKVVWRQDPGLVIFVGRRNRQGRAALLPRAGCAIVR